jgi:NADH-quinone oxidoreductase subunit J
VIPGGDFHPVLFALTAAWVLACGIGVVAFRSIVRSAVSMVLCFVGVAGIYALLYAPLLAIIQLLVYVGAISVVIIFAIMLTPAQSGDMRLFFNRQSLFALPLAIATALLLIFVLVTSAIPGVTSKAHGVSLKTLSGLLFNQYVFPFELVSFVLLAAMIGAIVLARREESS